VADTFGKKTGFMLVWPGLFLYFLGSRRTRVIMTCGEEILLIQDASRYFYDTESWALPGGGIRRGEEPTVAAARELREELGVSAEPDALTLRATQKSGGYGLQYTAHFFAYPVAVKPKLTLQPQEIKTARWFTLDEARVLPLKREARQGLALFAQQ
jgi:ADP-ribose pyrophosphatase YjhB (NUDIX family)